MYIRPLKYPPFIFSHLHFGLTIEIRLNRDIRSHRIRESRLRDENLNISKDTKMSGLALCDREHRDEAKPEWGVMLSNNVIFGDIPFLQ